MKFSILLNSRERPELLMQCIGNINGLATHPEEVEILIGCDLDDEKSREISKFLSQEYSNLIWFWEPRNKNLHQYINFMAKHASGQYLWVINDDAIIEQVGWDIVNEHQIEEIISKLPDRIAYFQIGSNSADKVGDYAEFPMITREAYETLGILEYEEFSAWGADVVLKRIYEEVGRAFKINWDRPIRHVLHEKGSESNPVRDHMIDVFKGEFGENWGEAVNKMQEHTRTVDLSSYTNKLLGKINACSSSM